LLDLLNERMKISEAIGKYKFENNITILQTRRYDEIMNNRRDRGAQRGLDEEFITRIFESIHEESISRQNEIMNKALSKKQKSQE